MNRQPEGGSRQSGVALAVALIFLLVVTIISVVAAGNSTMGLKMSTNMQDAYSSFQSAEAGIFAALALAASTADPFDADDDMDPNTAAYLSHIKGGAGTVDVDVFLVTGATDCPRNSRGSSITLTDCEYYRIAAEHNVARKARSKVHLGVVKEIIGSN